MKKIIGFTFTVIVLLVMLTFCYYSSDDFEKDGLSLEDVTNVETDDLVNELKALGFTEEESTLYRERFLQCGIGSIAAAKPLSDTATIDDLVAYRIVVDGGNNIIMFTIDKRDVFNIQINGIKLYYDAEGGFIQSISELIEKNK